MKDISKLKEKEDIITSIENPITGGEDFFVFNTSLGMNIKSKISDLEDMDKEKESIINELDDMESRSSVESKIDSIASKMEELDDLASKGKEDSDEFSKASDELSEISDSIPDKYLDLSKDLDEISKKSFDLAIEVCCMILSPCDVNFENGNPKFKSHRDVDDKFSYMKNLFNDLNDCMQVITLFLKLSGTYIQSQKEQKIKMY